jgi:hypothetical protein
MVGASPTVTSNDGTVSPSAVKGAPVPENVMVPSESESPTDD